MSSYIGKAINPRTGKVEQAWFLDNHFGRHCYGVRFEGEEHVYPAKDVRLPAKEQGDG